MKSKNLLFITLLSLTSIALTSCNDISMAVKSKGEEVSALEWSKSYIHSYDSNLSFFFDIVNAENNLPSYSYKYINQTTTKNVRTAIEDGNSSKENADQKTTQTGAFDSANNTYKTKKEISCKEIILKNSKDFNGNNNDDEVIKICGISRGSYYKYKRELKDK